MDYIVFDLEWNQCPDGKDKEDKRLPFEIIQIGAVKLNEQFEETDRFNEYIRPVLYKTLHFHTREILHVDIQSLRRARSFPEVASDFFSWCGTDPVYCTWGSSDLLELQRNLAFHGMESPFPFPLFYLDIQKNFSLQMEDGKSRRSLEYVSNLLNLPKSTPFHNALSDSIYTSRVMQKLDKQALLNYFSIDYYRVPGGRKEEILVQYGTYSKFVSKSFANKNDAMRDRKVASTPCYLCKKPAKKKIRWFTGNSRNYYCLCYCETHGWLKGKIRLKETEEDRVFAVKTLKLIGTEEAKRIVDRKDAVRRKNQRHRSS